MQLRWSASADLRKLPAPRKRRVDNLWKHSGGSRMGPRGASRPWAAVLRERACRAVSARTQLLMRKSLAQRRAECARSAWARSSRRFCRLARGSSRPRTARGTLVAASPGLWTTPRPGAGRARSVSGPFRAGRRSCGSPRLAQRTHWRRYVENWNESGQNTATARPVTNPRGTNGASVTALPGASSMRRLFSNWCSSP